MNIREEFRNSHYSDDPYLNFTYAVVQVANAIMKEQKYDFDGCIPTLDHMIESRIPQYKLVIKKNKKSHDIYLPYNTPFGEIIDLLEEELENANIMFTMSEL